MLGEYLNKRYKRTEIWESKEDAGEQKGTHHQCKKSFHCSAPMKPKMARNKYWIT